MFVEYITTVLKSININSEHIKTTYIRNQNFQHLPVVRRASHGVNSFPRGAAIDAALQNNDATVHISVEDSIQRNLVAADPNYFVAQLSK